MMHTSAGMRFTVLRIVGNELPPRDPPGSKLDCLKWLLDIDQSPFVRYVYLVNHIIDPHYRDQVLDVLREQEVIEMEFDDTMYRQIPDDASRLRYAININAARNFAIRYCQQWSDFVACLDQDCYFPVPEIERVIGNIHDDQVDSGRRQHYGVISKRCHISSIPADLHEIPDAEPSLIFRQDATHMFDGAYAFGNGDKLSLLRQLGYSVDNDGVRLHGEQARTVGACLHVSFGDPLTDSSNYYGGGRRTASLTAFLHRINELYPPRQNQAVTTPKRLTMKRTGSHLSH